MTEESYRSSNQRIEDERLAKKQKSKFTYRKASVHTTQRSAPEADMGSHDSVYVPPTVEDYIPEVRSDL